MRTKTEGSLSKEAEGSLVEQAEGSLSKEAEGSLVELGQIVGVWGVKGWVKLHSYTRNRTDIAGYPTWWLRSKRKSDELKPLNVLKCREQGQGIIAQLEGVDDRDQANALRGLSILVKQADMPELLEGEYYWQELIGLVVSNEQEKIGVIGSILETGANDVLVVKQIADEGVTDLPEVLIPYTPQVVMQVDVEQGTMLVDWDPKFLIDG